MLRPNIFNWLERKSVRPIMERVARSAARGPSASHSASHAAAGAASSSLYRAGDMDDVEEAESLDMMDDTPTESFGFHVPAAPRRHGHPPEARSRAAGSYNWSSGADCADAGSGAVELRDRPRREERPANPIRRVITVARRHHSSPTEAPSALRHAHAPASQAHLSSSPWEAQFTDHARDAPHHEGSEGIAAAAAESPADSNGGGSATVAEAAESSGTQTTTAKSSDAYRFLLHHIDAEIAALQRRHASVTTRRQSVQTRQTQRIKELFELMEHPWTLLPSEVQPALPATGVDVYIKEQQIARQQQNLAHPIPEGQDKMYVLALHKNYKSMPAGRKRFYEEAAHYNAAVREELKYLLTRGCSRFEAFLDSIKECTAEMAREGQVPELPTTHAQNRFNAARGSGSDYRHANTPKALPAGVDVNCMRSRKSHQPAHSQQGAAVPEVPVGDQTEAEEGDAGAEAEDESVVVKAAKESRRGAKGGSVRLKREQKASHCIKTTAKKARSSSTTAAAGKHSSAKATKARKGSPTSAKKKPIATSSKKGKNSIGARTGVNDRGIGKAVGQAASGAGVSRSIPLPNLDNLAITKIKRMLSPSYSSGGAAKKVAKKVLPSLKAAGGGKKKRKK